MYEPEVYIAKNIADFCKYRNYQLTTQLSEKDANNMLLMRKFITLNARDQANDLDIGFYVLKHDAEVSLSVPAIRQLAKTVTSQHTIFVVQEEFFKKASRQAEIATCLKDVGTFEIIKHEAMISVVPEHCTQGKVYVMTDDEVKELATGINKVLPMNMMTILHTDPLMIWYNCKKDTIVRIERMSQTAGLAIDYYRVR